MTKTSEFALNRATAWYAIGTILACLALWSPNADAVKGESAFSCKGYFNYHENSPVWGFIYGKDREAKIVLSREFEIQLKRVSAHKMSYEFFLKGKAIHDSKRFYEAPRSGHGQLAMTAHGVELHCVTNIEN